MAEAAPKLEEVKREAGAGESAMTSESQSVGQVEKVAEKPEGLFGGRPDYADDAKEPEAQNEKAPAAQDSDTASAKTSSRVEAWSAQHQTMQDQGIGAASAPPQDNDEVDYRPDQQSPQCWGGTGPEAREASEDGGTDADAVQPAAAAAIREVKENMQKVMEEAVKKLVGHLGKHRDGKRAAAPAPSATATRKVAAAAMATETTTATTAAPAMEATPNAGGPSAEANPGGDFDPDRQRNNDEWNNRIVVGRDLPDENWLKEIPTTGPWKNNILGADAVYDNEAFIKWANGLQWQAPVVRRPEGRR